MARLSIVGYVLFLQLALALAMVNASAVAQPRAGLVDAVRIDIGFSWTEIGAVTLGSGETLEFPEASADPALYRFSIDAMPAARVYVGETKNLRRRLAQYRTPGLRQITNIRINRALVDALKAHGRVTVSVVYARAVPAWNIRDKFQRVMLEHAAIVMAKTGGLTILNEAAEAPGK